MKILFLAKHRLNRNPGQRYRFEQYFDYFEKNGLECHLSNIVSEKDDAILYSSGNYHKKLLVAQRGISIRRTDLKQIKKGNYDLIVIYREAIMLGSTYFEKAISKTGIPTIFDFDDAIYIKDVSEGNRRLSFLKDADKINKILPLITHVTAGNKFLAAYAKKYNQNVTILPSTVDTKRYYPLESKKRPVTIGWIGSHTTVKHFKTLIPVLEKLKSKYKDQVQFKLVGDPSYTNDSLGIKGEKWINEKENELFNSLDIGVMPLPDDKWAEGKCGMKGLLYMSVGIPALFSPVGINTDIVEHGVNGYLPRDNKDWFDILCELIEKPQLRKEVGENGRKTVVEKYSTEAHKKAYLDLYLSLIKKGKNEENSFNA